MPLAAALLAGLLAAAPVASRPPALPVAEPPALTAEAYLLYDAVGDVVLVSHNATERRAMASVTKLMTALVVLDRVPTTDLVTITASAAATGQAEVGLFPGEVWSVRELLSAILVRSGNDAAVALAEYVGGSVAGFAELMNAKARELGLADTSFANPHGLDAEGHYTSANDLLALTRAALDDPTIARLVRTRVVKFRPDPNGDERRAINTNALLGAYPGVDGVKTGFTGKAGLVLVTDAVRGSHHLIGVVMGSEDHFSDSRALLQYGFDSLGPGDVIRSAFVGRQGGGEVGGAALPPWLRARLLAVPQLDDGRWAITEATPVEQAVTARLESLLPTFLGGER